MFSVQMASLERGPLMAGWKVPREPGCPVGSRGHKAWVVGPSLSPFLLSPDGIVSLKPNCFHSLCLWLAGLWGWKGSWGTRTSAPFPGPEARAHMHLLALRAQAQSVT